MAEPCPHCGAQLPDSDDAVCSSCRQPDEIAGLEGLTNEQILWELHHGAKFVEYQFCVSLVVVTLYRSSRIHFIRSHESAVARGMKYTLLSLLAGWWGIPFGPFCTIAAVLTNLCGGRNVTPTLGMMEALRSV